MITHDSTPAITMKKSIFDSPAISSEDQMKIAMDPNEKSLSVEEVIIFTK